MMLMWMMAQPPPTRPMVLMRLMAQPPPTRLMRLMEQLLVMRPVGQVMLMMRHGTSSGQLMEQLLLIGPIRRRSSTHQGSTSGACGTGAPAVAVTATTACVLIPLKSTAAHLLILGQRFRRFGTQSMLLICRLNSPKLIAPPLMPQLNVIRPSLMPQPILPPLLPQLMLITF